MKFKCKFCNYIIKRDAIGIWKTQNDNQSPTCPESTDYSNHIPEVTIEFSKLLDALCLDDVEEVNNIACALFITDTGGCDWGIMKRFEEYADVKIYKVESDSFGWLVGGIKFRNREFTFG